MGLSSIFHHMSSIRRWKLFWRTPLSTNIVLTDEIQNTVSSYRRGINYHISFESSCHPWNNQTREREPAIVIQNTTASLSLDLEVAMINDSSLVRRFRTNYTCKKTNSWAINIGVFRTCCFLYFSCFLFCMIIL